jgi:glycine oxidase
MTEPVPRDVQPEWDTIIVGQGLAGTTLAWHLLEAGQRVLVIDAEAAVTSSKIAAGLITPITGLRLTLSPRVDELLVVARAFYRRIEAWTGSAVYHERTAVRLFQSDAERQVWAKRRANPALAPHLITPPPVPLFDARLADINGGGFAMHAGQLDVAAYLVASRALWAAAGCYVGRTLDWRRDVAVNERGVELRPGGISSRLQGGGVAPPLRTARLISCEGFAAADNPFFPCVPFRSAKGDVLVIRLREGTPTDLLRPQQTLHRGIWVAPTAAPDVFRVGSTYDLAVLDCVPSVVARAEIERQLGELLLVPYDVLDHQAAVRPIIEQSQPRFGLHPQHNRLGFFNGLGSKGSLLAPWAARSFAQFLVHGTPIPALHDVRTLKWRELTDAARH